jgi:hypothetical protein
LREGQSFLLHPHVFKCVDQVPVQVFNLIDGGDHLQAKGYVGNLTVVFRNADETRVRQKAEALQKLLGDAKLKIRSDGGAQRGERIVGSDVTVVKTRQDVGARVEALLIAYVGGTGVGVGDRASAECAA